MGAASTLKGISKSAHFFGFGSGRGSSCGRTLGDWRIYRDSFSRETRTCILGLLVVCADAAGTKSTAASMAVIVLRMDFIAQFDSLISYTKNRTVASKNLLFLSM